MQDLINRLEALSDAWKDQFDNPPDLSFSWEIDAHTGVLSLNGKGICPAASIAPEGESYDVEYIYLATRNGCISITIDWPYAGPAKIGKVVVSDEIKDTPVDLKKIREDLQKLKANLMKDLEQDVFIGYKGFGTVKLDAGKLRVLGAFDILDDYLDQEIIQELLDAYTDEELEDMGWPKNLMMYLIEGRQIKLTPTPGAKGADCLAYKATAKENGCKICPYKKTCFPEGLVFKEDVK